MRITSAVAAIRQVRTCQGAVGVFGFRSHALHGLNRWASDDILKVCSRKIAGIIEHLPRARSSGPGRACFAGKRMGSRRSHLGADLAARKAAGEAWPSFLWPFVGH
jgi:hypothetical protein